MQGAGVSSRSTGSEDRVLKILTGVGVFAALTMSTIALLKTTNPTTTTASAASAVTAPAQPTSARIAIVHATHGCHTLAVNGASSGQADARRSTWRSAQR